MTDLSINQSLQECLDQFFSSLQNGGESLHLFLDKWSTFSESVRRGRDKLQQKTLLSVHNFATMVHMVTSDVLQLEEKSNCICREIDADITTILDKEFPNLAIEDKSSTSHSEASDPAYVRPSYIWLLSNLHNPYPSKDFKKQIAQESNCSLKDVDTWFVEARKRIGWNRLRKAHFANNQEAMLSSAAQVLIPEVLTLKCPPTQSSSSSICGQIRVEFTAMVDKAQSLYPHIIAEIRNAQVSLGVTSDVLVALPDPGASYPTPRSTPDYSPEVPLSSPSVHDPLPVSSVKRRRSSCDSAQDKEHSIRSQKRRRLGRPDDHIISLPSPATTVELHSDGIEDNLVHLSETTVSLQFQSSTSDPCKTPALKRKRSTNDAQNARPRQGPVTSYNMPHPEVRPTASEKTQYNNFAHAASSLPSSATNATSMKRKRRLSDGGKEQTKRPNNARCIARLQTVSDPLPLPIRLQECPEEIPIPERRLGDIIPSSVDPPSAMLNGGVALEVQSHQYGFCAQKSSVQQPSADFLSEATSLNAADPSIAQKLIVSQELSLDAICGTPPFDFFDFTQASRNQFNLLPSPSPEDAYNFVAPIQNLDASSGLGYSYNPEPQIFSSVYENNFHGHTSYTSPFDGIQAKRVRVQALKAELRMLEGEIYSR
ncbi:hypothetical protein D9613_002220 [Agrocybe pediades]|uniref:Uncharacterized protein n=1 Tax=Agrocybe pediades TaxID=84607 RepID=A0A8H4R6N1_9AGAR|nr:hypothetical protein D9613_002220 [Agrocybe pediades]